MLALRLRLPTRKRRVTIISDGNKQNITGIQTHFPQGSVNYGVRKKIRRGQKVVGIVSMILLGNIPRDEIAINHVDGFCSKIRERVPCFVRKARSFAKRKVGLEGRFEIFSVSHNWLEAKHGETPAMREGLCTRAYTWSEILHRHLATLN